MLVLPVFIICQDESEAFSNGNETTVNENTVNVSDIFAGDTPVPNENNTATSGAVVNPLDGMSGSSEPALNQNNNLSVAKKEATANRVIKDKSQTMNKSNEINIEAQAKTRQQMEQDVQDLYKEGKKYYDIEDYEGASEIWMRLLTNYSTSKNLHTIRYSLANAYEYALQYDNAIAQYQKVLAENPKLDISIEANYRLAGCYVKLEKYPQAIEIYKDIILRGPSKIADIRAYFSLANIYMKQGNYKKVELIYKNIVKSFPNSASEIQGRFQLAQLYAQTSRFKSAVKEYKLIMYKYKNTEWAPKAAIHIGDTYKLAGEYRNAREAYSIVINEYYKYDVYTLQAEERIKSLKSHKAIEDKFYAE